jgi:hypothetical protein
MYAIILAALSGIGHPPLTAEIHARIHLAAVTEAIRDEIDDGIEATITQDIDRYMATVPVDYRIAGDDGSTVDREALRAEQLRAWALIRQTNALSIDIERVEPGCDGQCARVWTNQRWDRQMIGRDGVSEHHVVTTQRHIEQWEVRDSRWINVAIEELGGTTMVDGTPY